MSPNLWNSDNLNARNGCQLPGDLPRRCNNLFRRRDVTVFAKTEKKDIGFLDAEASLKSTSFLT